jgi:hypothetical protein
MVAEENPNGLNKYKDSPTQLANKLPGAVMSNWSEDRRF